VKEKIITFFSTLILIGGLGLVFFFILSGRFDVQFVASHLTKGHSLFISAGIFLLIWIIRPLFPIPFSIMTIAGGIVFGMWTGLILSFIGSTAGGIVDFYFARKTGKEALKKIIGKRFDDITERVKEKEILSVAMMRLIPFMNFDILNYLLGISGISLKGFILGSWLGLSPWFILLILTGHSLKTSNKLLFIIASLLIIILMLLFLFISRRGERNNK